MTAASFSWDHRRGPAVVLHDITPPVENRPTAWILEVDEPTVVLGSGQSSTDVDAARADAASLRVVRRRSGGGAVLLIPGEHVWIDVWVPAGSRWWHDDVVTAGGWLADVWVDALGAARGELEIHAGPMTRTRWSPIVCFAGLGPGEVTAGGRKLVGVSQRRTREWARFQCIVHRRWNAAAMFGVLAAPDAGVGVAEWRDAVAVVGDDDIESAFVDALARA